MFFQHCESLISTVRTRIVQPSRETAIAVRSAYFLAFIIFCKDSNVSNFKRQAELYSGKIIASVIIELVDNYVETVGGRKGHRCSVMDPLAI